MLSTNYRRLFWVGLETLLMGNFVHHLVGGNAKLLDSSRGFNYATESNTVLRRYLASNIKSVSLNQNFYWSPSKKQNLL